MIKSIVLAILLTATVAVAQDAPKDQPRPQRPQVVQCEEMQKLMKQMREHRATCESCKTNLPPRRFGPGPAAGPGPRDGQGPRGPQGPRGRGPGGPSQR